VGFLCRPPRRAHALICAARSHGLRRGPHYCAANAASDDTEAPKLTLMVLHRINPIRCPRQPSGSFPSLCRSGAHRRLVLCSFSCPWARLQLRSLQHASLHGSRAAKRQTLLNQDIHRPLNRNPHNTSVLIDPPVAIQDFSLRSLVLLEVLRRRNLQARLGRQYPNILEW